MIFLSIILEVSMFILKVYLVLLPTFLLAVRPVLLVRNVGEKDNFGQADSAVQPVPGGRGTVNTLTE